jgi:hypothetical protein
MTERRNAPSYSRTQFREQQATGHWKTSGTSNAKVVHGQRANDAGHTVTTPPATSEPASHTMLHRYNLQPTESRPIPSPQRPSTVTESHTEGFSRTREHKPPCRRAAGRGPGGAGVEPLQWSPTPRRGGRTSPGIMLPRRPVEGQAGGQGCLIKTQPSQGGSRLDPLTASRCLELSFPIDTRRTAQARASRFTAIQAQQHAAQ